MENISNIQDRIDQYFLNKMSNEESILFEEEIKSNPELHEKVALQKMIFEEINRKENFLSLLRASDNDRSQKVRARKMFFYRTISLAAMITGIAFIIWQPTQLSNQKIADTYSTFHPNKFSMDAGIDENTRSIGNMYWRFDSLEIQNIIQSLKYFENNNYNLAAASFEKIANLKEKNADLALLMAISQLKSGDSEKALLNFEYLSKQSQFLDKELAYYYLALSNIQLGKLSVARKMLRILKTNNGTYSNSANEILHKMRYF